MVLHLPSGDTSAFFEGQPTVIPLEASGEKRTWLITYATEARWTDADREALAQILEASELVVDAQRVPLKGRFTISSYGGPVNELFVRISRTD